MNPLTLKLHRPQLPPSAKFFFHLSRFGMAVTGTVLSVVLVYSINQAFHHKAGAIGDIISACSALSILCMTVFGYHATKYGVYVGDAAGVSTATAEPNDSQAVM